VEVVLRGEEQQVSDEDEGGAQDEGEEQLDVHQVPRAVEPPVRGSECHIPLRTKLLVCLWLCLIITIIVITLFYIAPFSHSRMLYKD